MVYHDEKIWRLSWTIMLEASLTAETISHNDPGRAEQSHLKTTEDKTFDSNQTLWTSFIIHCGFRNVKGYSFVFPDPPQNQTFLASGGALVSKRAKPSPGSRCTTRDFVLSEKVWYWAPPPKVTRTPRRHACNIPHKVQFTIWCKTDTLYKTCAKGHLLWFLNGKF